MSRIANKALKRVISIGVIKDLKHIIENNTYNIGKKLHIYDWWVSEEKFFQVDFAD